MAITVFFYAAMHPQGKVSLHTGHLPTLLHLILGPVVRKGGGGGGWGLALTQDEKLHLVLIFLV